MVGQLRDLKEVGGQAAHQHAGAVIVIEIKAQLLHMVEKVPADIRLHPDAEGVAPVEHHIVQQAPQHKGRRHDGHDHKEDAVLLVRQPLVHGRAGHQRKHQVDERDDKGAGHVQYKQSLVLSQVVHKHLQQRFPLLFTHEIPLLLNKLSAQYSILLRPVQAFINPLSLLRDKHRFAQKSR